MANSLLETRYVKAFSLAVGHKAAILEGLDSLLWLLTNDDLLMDLLLNPIVDTEQKIKSIQSICAKVNADASIVHFLSLLIQKNRVSLLKQLNGPLRREIDRVKNQLGIKVTTAVDLTDTQQHEFVRLFSTVTGKTVSPTFCVEPALLGGFKVEYDNTLFDGTIRHTLSKLEKSLRSKGL